MKDSGLVINTHSDLADVEVQCLVDACESCRARMLCGPQGPTKGRLTVRNPIGASAGDEVEIEIPETNYNSALIMIFSTLLTSVLLGLAFGYLFSLLFSVSSQELSLLGLILTLPLAGLILFRYFRRKNNALLYPIIIHVLKKGAQNG